MNNLFTQTDTTNILSRLDKLTADSQRKWGLMTVDQMLAHCVAAFKVANGEAKPKRILLGWILGPIVKNNFLGEKPFPRSTPTDKTFIVKDRRDFEQEKHLLKEQINKFADGGEAGVTVHPHSFFGKLTPQQWSIGMWKHLDHHFRQFGV